MSGMEQKYRPSYTTSKNIFLILAVLAVANYTFNTKTKKYNFILKIYVSSLLLFCGLSLVNNRLGESRV